MKIVHLLSQKYLTGAEVYAVRLAEQQMASGGEVIIVSDTINTPTDLKFISLPIYSHNYFVRLSNVFKLVQICKKNKIDVIHAHSRAACWVANLACKIAKVAYVVTLHDVQKAHRSARLWNIYGQNMIAVSEVIKDDFISKFGVPEHHIKVIRNGL